MPDHEHDNKNNKNEHIIVPAIHPQPTDEGYEHHRHNDRNNKCEYDDECNTPHIRVHRRRDDMHMSMTKWVASLLGACVTTIVITGLAGLLMTESRIEAIIAKHPAVVSLQDNVKNIGEDLREAKTAEDLWHNAASNKLETLEGTVNRIAYVTGAVELKGVKPSSSKVRPKPQHPSYKVYSDKKPLSNARRVQRPSIEKQAEFLK